MPYALGIDLGSSHLTAAICRNDHERWSEPEVLALDGMPVTKAVLHLTDEGTVEVGDRALRQVVARPDRITRGFVDRVGDEIPITLAGQPYPTEVLIAAVVGWIVDYAEATEAGPVGHLVVTHPAGWGSHRRATLLGALREVSLPELTLLPRPVAAAESYAATERIEVGQELAVHSLGAGRFEAAVLRRGSFGFDLRAHADSTETTGGDLFDDLLAARVLDELGHEVEPVPLAKLRAACRSAKERLSTELAVTVPAPPRSPRGTVMVNRTDLEELIRPAVEATVTSLQRTIRAAGSSTSSLRAVVLVGGCGRIPLVSELVTAGVRVRVAAAAEPELSVARGAAMAAARVAKQTTQSPEPTHTPEPIALSAVTHTDLMSFDDRPEEELAADIGPPPPRPPVEITPLEPPKRRVLRLGSKADDDEDDGDSEERDEERHEERSERRREGLRERVGRRKRMAPEDLDRPRERDRERRRVRNRDHDRDLVRDLDELESGLDRDLDLRPAHRRHSARELGFDDLDLNALRADPDDDIDLDDAGMGPGRPRGIDSEYEGEFDLPPRRRYRIDDRAFNESLSRRTDYADEIDGEYEVVDERRRGRGPR
jgi:actin-like ATPase involved in cell morphogenesis